MIRLLRIAAVASLLLAAACSGTTDQGSVPLAQAKVWVSGISNAIVAASAVYTGPHADQVHQAAASLQIAAASFQNIADVSTARSAALTVVGIAQQIVPLVSPVLGDRALYVSGGLIVVQAFIAALPMPPPVVALNGVK